jgi:hypothetical protein
MQEAIVFILFFGIIGLFAYRFLKRRKNQGCAQCDFNPETEK